MFMELFKYIAGVNQVRVQILAARWFWKLMFIFIYVQEGQEVEMTRPVSTLHKIEQKQAGGEETPF